MSKFIKYFALSLVGILLIGSVNAQRNVKLGNKYFKKFDYKTATEFYLKAVEKDPENVKAIEKLALCYKNMGDFDQSALWLGEYVALNNDSANYNFYYAQSLRANQKYDEALEYYDSYMASSNQGFVSDIVGSGFEYIAKLRIPNPNIEVQNATPLNSEASDFGVAFKDLGTITYCSTRDASEGAKDNWTHEKYTDLYSSTVSYEGQESPTKFANNKYNGIYHDGPAMFYGDEMYLTRSNYVRKKVKKAKDDKTVKLQLHEVDLNSPKKSVKKYSDKLIFNDKEYSIAHATISLDGKYLLFSSDGSELDGHIGGTDLYLSTRNSDENKWNDPKNLGGMINTPADEEYPYFGDDGRIYFASNGHYGLGGLDIYSTTMNEDGEWSQPVNMGAPINSSYDDFNYIFNNQDLFGFFSSNRPGGLGSDDIYSFKLLDDNYEFDGAGTKVRFLAYDATTLEPLEGVLLEVPACLDEDLTTDKYGKAKSPIDNFVKCRVNASLEEYYPKEVPFSVFDKDVDVEIPLYKKSDGSNIQLQVCVYDRKTLQPIPNTEIKVFNETEGRFESKMTDESGCMVMENINPEQCYGLVGSKEINEPNQKYLTTTDEVCTYGVTAPAFIQKALYLDYVTLGQPLVGSNSNGTWNGNNNTNVGPNGLVLPIIYYDLDKFNIRTDAARELNELIKIMRDNPTLHIEAASHTDCRRDEDYNMTLSKNRAKEAVAYLVEKGISRSRLTWGAYGEKQHVNKCDCECEGDIKEMGLRPFRDCEDTQIEGCTEQDHQNNRRTEFVVTKF